MRVRACVAEAAGTALLVWAILLAAGLTLGADSAVAQALPGREAGFLLLGVLIGPWVALHPSLAARRMNPWHLTQRSESAWRDACSCRRRSRRLPATCTSAAPAACR